MERLESRWKEPAVGVRNDRTMMRTDLIVAVKTFLSSVIISIVCETTRCTCEQTEIESLRQEVLTS